MSDAGLQEILALGVVALVVGIALWRRARRRKSASACSNCDAPAARSRETTLRFYRKRP